MERSGILDSVSEASESLSTSNALSEEDGLYEAARAASRDMEFIHVLEASREFNIPSLAISSLGIPDEAAIQSVRAAAPLGASKLGIDYSDHIRDKANLGAGMTSFVIRHVTNQETVNVVPLGTTVAVKVFKIHSNESLGRKKDRARVFDSIMREIRVFCHSGLRGHPNIVQLLFIGWQKEADFPMLAIELGHFGSLDQIITSNNVYLSSLDKWHLTLDIALGLYAIHEAELAYGDLKPDNVLIMSHPDPARQMTAKLTDFGGASPTTREAGGGPAHFTPMWSAPEVMYGDRGIDWKKADIYSYGLVVASLWLRPEAGGGFKRDGQESSSCFLSEFIRRDMDGSTVSDTLWVIKSLSEPNPAAILPMIRDRLDIIEEDNRNYTSLLEILGAVLHADFWLRWKSEALIVNLAPIAEELGRDVE